MMRRILSLATVIILAAACGQPIVEEVSTTGDIAGVVYDKNVGDPISVAQVQLTPGGASTVTGTDGSFTFKNIEAGGYTVTVTKKGYNDASNKVTVAAGKKADCHLLMERIPAYVTADKSELDFGDNLTLTTLSFNIVNSSYENLSWHIDYDKSSSSFITEVTPESGTTQYGKTAVIVVKIDRDKLNAGANESTIVVVSDNGDGSSEVKVKAIGQEKSKATVNVKSVTEITASTAIVNGEITFPGVPSYLKRGFVYATTENPTIDVTVELVEVSVTDEAQFSYMLKGLSLGVKYYVRAYAINDVGVAYSNQESFLTVPSLPVVSVSSPDHIDASNKTAALHGSVESVGDPAYFEKGFVYCEGRKTPTIDDRYVHDAGTGLGAYSESISELKLGSTYSVRAYAKNEGGISYSDKTVEFTLSGSSPVVSVGETTDINLIELSAILHGTLDSVGSPAASEKGFVYSSVNNIPTDSDLKVTVSGGEVGSYYAAISKLELGKTYFVRAYAINEAGIVYSSKTTSFSTAPTAPVVTVQSVTNINLEQGTAIFHGTVEVIGDPPYTERGFVFSATNTLPSIKDSYISVGGNGIGTYEAIVTQLEIWKTYYVRAYAKHAAGVSYSENVVEVTISGITPKVSVSEPSDFDFSSMSVVLNGYVSEVGYPAITERGFVYSKDNSVPTINDRTVTAEGSISGAAYSIKVNNFMIDNEYYVKAYVSNTDGVFYSDNTVSVSTKTTYPSVTIKDYSGLDIEKERVVLHGIIDDTGYPIYTECGFVISTDQNLPTISDTKLIAPNSGISGDFEYAFYELSKYKKTYIRAYAINYKGVSYSESVVTIDPSFVISDNHIILGTIGIAVQKDDNGGRADYSVALQRCEQSDIGGFYDWRLPTIEELFALYGLREKIGGFYAVNADGSYWSSTLERTSQTGDVTYYYYYCLSFWSGNRETSYYPSSNSTPWKRVRCVRTL